MTFAAAPLDEQLRSLWSAIEDFGASLADVRWAALTAALACFGLALVVSSRVLFNVLRAAYPGERFQWRRIWGAYMAAYGLNNFVPAASGNLLQIYLTKRSIPRSRYPAICSALLVPAIFQLTAGVLVVAYSFSQDVFPTPPDLSDLHAFDLAYFATHPKFTLFLVTAIAVAALVAFALLARRVQAFWARVRQGAAILADRSRYLRDVLSLQVVGWLLQFATYWLLLEAFHLPGSVRNVLLVIGVQFLSSAVPLAPSGAGVQQALLISVFAGAAPAGVVTAYSVGQQVALASFTTALGFIALVAVFGIRGFRAAVRQARDDVPAGGVLAPPEPAPAAGPAPAREIPATQPARD